MTHPLRREVGADTPRRDAAEEIAMAKGGARTNSGPSKDPKSGRSERAGYSMTALPNEGYTGRIPGLNQYMPKPTARHRAHWNELWRQPQACMWINERWKWAQVARLVRLRVVAEFDCPATIFGEILKLETKLGLNDEGMRFLGWAVAPDEVADKATNASREAAEDDEEEAPRRLSAVPNA